MTLDGSGKMDKKLAARTEAETRKKSEARAGLILAVVFGGMVVLMIAGMIAFDIYGEKQAGRMNAPAASAGR